MQTKYGIKCIALDEYNADFIHQAMNASLHWEDIARNKHRIQTFLNHIAKIKYSNVKVYSCLPSPTSSDYYVLVNIDGGKQYMLISTIRDSHQYPRSYERVKKLQDELLYLDVEPNFLSNLHKEIVDQLHPDEQFHPKAEKE